jgi:hypothetical protein
MINKALVALIFSFLTANCAFAYAPGATLEEKNTEDRCFVLNKLAKTHGEIVAAGASEGELYSIIFNFDALTHVAGVKLTKETQERVRNLKQVQADLENKLFKGEAKATALRKTFYEMNGIVKSTINEANKNYPECHILNDGTPTKATASQPTTKPASATPVR